MNRTCRTRAALVRNWKVPVCNRFGNHLFYSGPKRGASPILSRRPGPPEWLRRTIALKKLLGGAATIPCHASLHEGGHQLLQPLTRNRMGNQRSRPAI